MSNDELGEFAAPIRVAMWLMVGYLALLLVDSARMVLSDWAPRRKERA